MSHRTRMRRIAVATLVAALVAGSSPLLSAQPRGKKVRIAQTGHFLALASASVAWHKGYLKDAGLDGEVVIAPGRQGVLGLMSGEFQFRAGSPNDIMLMAEKGETMTAIVDIETYVDLPLVLRADVAQRLGVTPRDPVAKRLAAMNGLSLAVTGEGDAGDLALRFMLKEANLKPTDVKKVVIANPVATLAAWDQRQIDGFVGGSPRAVGLQAEGKGVILIEARDIPMLNNVVHEVVYGLKSWIDVNPEETRAVARAMVRANRFLKEDPSAGVFLQQTDYKTWSPQILQASVDRLKPHIPADGKMTRERWEWTMRYALESGMISRPLDMSEGKYWTNKYLE
jgi:ABC-type nitrate/sulfonate/bicarbonate transport system substrate-binding protein